MTDSKQQELFTLYRNERERLKSLSKNAEKDGEYEAPVFGEGSLSPTALFIGEAPGAEETIQSKPFVGKAGQQLNELLKLATLQREDIYITNTVKYRPVNRKEKSVSNRTPDMNEISASLPTLKSEIGILNPAVIVTLGNTPLTAICLLAGIRRMKIGETHGRPIGISIGGYACSLFPLYHPASVIYNRTLQETLCQDILSLKDHLSKNDLRSDFSHS